MKNFKKHNRGLNRCSEKRLFVQPDLFSPDLAPVPSFSDDEHKPRVGCAVRGQLPTKPSTVIAEVLARLLNGQTLTHLDAWILSYTSRLAAHIHKLKELGWSIITIIEPMTCGDGRTAHIARYKLTEPPEVVGHASIRAFVEKVTQARLSVK